MNRALILHHSRTGTTAAYGEEIAAGLSGLGVQTTVLPMYLASTAPVQEADTIFLGCWTSGLFVILQKPEPDWVRYLKQLPDLGNKEIVLFTTYKFLTGSMFREMARYLPGNARLSLIKLKSRNGKLTESNKQLINLLASQPPTDNRQPLTDNRQPITANR